MQCQHRRSQKAPRLCVPESERSSCEGSAFALVAVFLTPKRSGGGRTRSCSCVCISSSIANTATHSSAPAEVTLFAAKRPKSSKILSSLWMPVENCQTAISTWIHASSAPKINVRSGAIRWYLIRRICHTNISGEKKARRRAGLSHFSKTVEAEPCAHSALVHS